jgi:Putative prokaryotic signal transducing protein
MKQVFVSQDLIEVEMRKERLEQAGIQCMIKNQRSSSLAGEIPFVEIFPELWVIQDEDYYRARQLLEEETDLLPSNQDFWTCSGCGERHEGQFGVCWECGQEKPSP